MTNIRFFLPSDISALVSLFAEMQRYYKVSCPEPDIIARKLSSLPAGVEIIVAEAEKIIGFAAFSSIYPGPSLTSGLFMKELFVTAEARGTGTGKALVQAVARIAVEQGHKRVDWTADRDNPELLRFYSSFGALVQQEKVFYRLSGDALLSQA